MRVVTRLTGLRADTIRTWERRYGAVEPRRTDGNTRKYSTDDVQRLELLRELTRQGHRIGEIARLPAGDLEALAAETGNGGGASSQVSARGGFEGSGLETARRDYLEAISRYEVSKARHILSRFAAILTPLDFVNGLLLPIMRELGDRWELGEITVSQEHLATAQVRGLLETLLATSPPVPGAQRIVFVTPAGFRHELGALCGAMLAALRGVDALYLGPDVPTADLLDAIRQGGVDVAVLSIIGEGKGSKKAALRAIETIAAEVETWVGLRGDHPFASSLDGAKILTEFSELEPLLIRIGLSTR